jgi:nucleotide-binding universal stress UspA family protein
LQAVGYAVDLARRADASVTCLQVIEWLAEEEPREVGPFDVPEFRRHLMQDARGQLQAFIAEQPPISRGADARVAAGRAYREILLTASEVKADLIVMGARGRGGPPPAPLGSTTQQVVREACCPVLTVPAPGESA